MVTRSPFADRSSFESGKGVPGEPFPKIGDTDSPVAIIFLMTGRSTGPSYNGIGGGILPNVNMPPAGTLIFCFPF